MIAFDVALHLGTLVTVLWYFRKEWGALTLSGILHHVAETEAQWTDCSTQVPIDEVLGGLEDFLYMKNPTQSVTLSVRDELLAVPRLGWINLHFSVLPAWRGAAPVQAAIAAGDEVTGATTFQIERPLDSGPVYGVLTETVRPIDTAGDLLARLADAGAGLLETTLDGIEDGALTAVPQPTDGVTIAPKVTVEDARVRWDLPAHVVDRRIRAVSPNPGAWTEIGDLRVKLGPVVPVDAEPLAPGAIRVQKAGVLVGTGSTPVRLGTVQPPGKKSMNAADWARGARLDEGVVAR